MEEKNKNMSSITFTVFPPPESLIRDVECIRVAAYTGDQGLAVKVCPNGLPGIVFQLGQDGPAIDNIATRSAQVSGLPILFLHGQGAEPSIMNFRKVVNS